MSVERDSALSIVITRALGTVVVTVGGNVDANGCDLLQGILRDLVDDQGNLDVVLDLSGVDAEAQSSLVAMMKCLGTSLGCRRWRLARPSRSVRGASTAIGRACVVGREIHDMGWPA